MPLKITSTLVQRIPLNLTTDEDPDQDTWVEIREATQAEQESRDNMFAEASQVYRDNEGKKEIELRTRFAYQEQKRRETFLVLCGCNILNENGKPLFNFHNRNGKMVLAMDEMKFAELWGSLPASVADAIHDAVLQVNKQWNPKST